MPVCYSCGCIPDAQYRCIYHTANATVTVLLCQRCMCKYPFTNLVHKDLRTLVRELPVVEAIQPQVVARAEEEGERWAVAAMGTLALIVMAVALLSWLGG